MTQHYRFTRDGTPVTGQMPVHIRAVGGLLSRGQRSAVTSQVNTFIAQVRAGGLSQLRKTVYLADGTRVVLSHLFGTTTATAYPSEPSTTSPASEEEFVGGIVVELFSRGPADEIVRLPESESSGKGPGLPGRPAVPGVAETDTTTHVVVQIKKGVSLSENPIRNGHVVIRRIKDPALGTNAEVPRAEQKYLVSANDDFSEFYLRGKRLTDVPALELPDTAEFALRPSARIGTIGFDPESFTGVEPGGTLFVAVGNRLYGFDSSTPAGGWQLLSELSFSAPFQYINAYGDTLALTQTPNTLTLSCSGSNGAGVCSGFVGTMARNPDGSRTLSGTVSPMHDGSVAAAPGAAAYAVQGVIEGVYVAGTIGAAPVAYAVNSYDLERTYEVAEGVAEKRTDRILGGFLPGLNSVAYSEILAEPIRGVWNAWVITEGGIEPSYTTSSEFTYVLSREGAPYLSLSFSWSLTTAPEGGSFSAPSLTVVGADPQTQTVLPPSPIIDRHTGKLLLRHSPQCSQTVTVTYPEGTFDLNGRLLPPGSTNTERGALTVGREVVRNTGEVLASTTDALARYVPALPWAGPDSSTSPVTEFYQAGGGGAFKVPTRLKLETAFDAQADNPEQIFSSPIYQEFTLLVAHGVGGAAADVIFGLVPGDAVAGPPPGTYTHNDIFYGPGSPSLLSAEDYVALFPPTTFDPPPGSPIVIVSPTAGDSALVTDEYKHFAMPQPPDGSFVLSGEVLYDIRSTGFLVRGDSRNIDALDVTRREAEQWIGNDTSIVPLADVLEEWRALGTISSVATEDIRFRGVDEVSLI